jgi:hypothetical protein
VTAPEPCSWCGEEVEADDGFRAGEEPGGGRACFCRLEHAVPWELQGARWEPGEVQEPPGFEDDLARCAHCGERPAGARVLLVRHRGEHRIPDAFCSAGHMAAWAKAGGRYG